MVFIKQFILLKESFLFFFLNRDTNGLLLD